MVKEVKKTAAGGRSRKLTKKQQKAKGKKEARKQTPIPGSFSLTRQTFSSLKKFWKPLGGIFLVYLGVNILFASDVPANLSSTLNDLKQTWAGSHHFGDALNGYGSLLGGSSGGTQTGSIMPSVLLVLESLVIIWALRQLLGGKNISVKQAYYKSMVPLVPFLLVIAMIFVQLLPLTLGGAILGLIATSLSSTLVSVIAVIIFVALACWSIYMVSGSIFAMYIVTLPNMEPRPALRSAKGLVSFRRWTLLRRLFFLPLFVFVILGLVTIPLILIAQFLVVPVFYLLIMLTVIFVHTYLYNLYKALMA